MTQGAYHQAEGVTLFLGDCRDVMKTLDADSVDAICTDPPYGLEFMGKEWDKLLAKDRHVDYPSCRSSHGPNAYVAGLAAQEWHHTWALEALRVLKPGGHMVAFGGTRTHHRLWCAVEDAGFEVRDCLMWVYGSGFPKGSRVNRSPMFCQCAEAGRSGVNKDHEQQRVAHTGKGERLSDGGPLHEDARRLTSRPLDSQGDYLQGSDSDDAPSRQGARADQASSQQQECAPRRSHSAAPVDAQDSESLHSPSQAQCSGRPANKDSSLGVGCAANGQPQRRQGNKKRADTSESVAHKQDTSLSPSYSHYAPGFPRCQVCGKPNADGWNVALKPAWEPILLCRKPIEKNVAHNVQKHGTGALNVDGCRVAGDWQKESHPAPIYQKSSDAYSGRFHNDGEQHEIKAHPSGRWPANLVLDEEAAAMLDAQSGETVSVGGGGLKTNIGLPGEERRGAEYPAEIGYGDSGGASRFFYTSKAGPDERGGTKHPTVKPRDLMLWLCKLITPPGGLILDPFIGSGTTAVAARMGGFQCIGIDNNEEYLSHAAERLRLGDEGLCQVNEARKQGHEQMTLFHDSGPAGPEGGKI